MRATEAGPLIARRLYRGARRGLYTTLLALDRLTVEPGRAAAPGGGRGAQRILILAPDDTPEGTLAFSRARELQRYLLRRGHRVELLFVGASLPGAARLLGRLAAPRATLAVIPCSFAPAIDGVPQALLEAAGIPHTGPSALAAGICLDKALTKRLALSVGVATPRFVVLEPGDPDARCAALRYPLVVKPLRGSSGLGVCRVQRPAQLARARRAARRFDPRVLVEEFLQGQEVTVGLLGSGGAVRTLGILQLPGRVMRFGEKRSASEGPALPAAALPAPAEAALRGAAQRVYTTIGCGGVARADFIVCDGVAQLLELNAVPSLHPGSMLAQSAERAGLSYDDLIQAVLQQTT